MSDGGTRGRLEPGGWEKRAQEQRGCVSGRSGLLSHCFDFWTPPSLLPHYAASPHFVVPLPPSLPPIDPHTWITSPRAERDLLMFCASLSRSPWGGRRAIL